MFFIGQEHFMSALGDILTYVDETKKGVNILFRGASGYGKTEISRKCCNFLVGQNYQTCLGSNLRFDRKCWVHFIDEVHLLENPENLYPIMDSGLYVIIMATNFDSILPEALTNRCKNFVFTDYTDGELREIFRFHSKLKFSDRVVSYIIDVAGRNPRVIVKTFNEVLEMHYRNPDIIADFTDDQIIETINSLFGIEGGLDKISRQYLECLKSLGGRASINLISSVMKLDLNTIKYITEPVLIYKKMIKITSRGRELCQ